ncbi:MAG: hypothetical protein ACPHID_01265 [Thermoplasmatota archaeon]
MRLFAAFLLIATALAGCSDAPAPQRDVTSAQCLEQGQILQDGICVAPPFEIRDFEDPNHHCVVTQQDDRVHAPDLVGNPWQLGQSWTYRLTLDGEDQGTTQLVYYDDQDIESGVAQHYMVGTPTREEALRHALFGENPMIGRVHRILYSPHESGDHADMFHFPLCEGSTWTTVFYGETFTLTSRSATLDLPSGQDHGFLIEGRSQEGGTLALSYSPRAQWFTFIDLTRADGSTVQLELEATGTNYQGDAFFLRGQQDDRRLLTGEAVLPNVMAGIASETLVREDGRDGAYDTMGLHILFGQTGQGVVQLILTAPNGTQPYAVSRDAAGLTQETIEVPYQAGSWTLELQGLAADPAQASYYADVRVVSIYDRSGSV